MEVRAFYDFGAVIRIHLAHPWIYVQTSKKTIFRSVLLDVAPPELSCCLLSVSLNLLASLKVDSGFCSSEKPSISFPWAEPLAAFLSELFPLSHDHCGDHSLSVMAPSACASPLNWDLESKNWAYYHMFGPNDLMQGWAHHKKKVVKYRRVDRKEEGEQ